MKTNVYNFWKKKRGLIKWYKFPNKIFEWNNNNHPHWFKDGKINISFNCLEENLKLNPSKAAIHFVDKNFNIETVNYKTLDNYINFFSAKIKNVKKTNYKKNICMIHASASKASAVSMLSCSKLGIFHSVIFEELEKQAIKLRMKLLRPNIFITRYSDRSFLKSIETEMKKINMNKFKIFVFGKMRSVNSKNIEFIDLDKIDFKNLKVIRYNFVKSNTPSFCLFTSGSTGIPKGIIHSTGGYMLFAKLTCKNQFGMNEKTTVLTASDAGWINGHTYALYGPLSLGSTVVMIEKPFSLTDKKKFEKMIKDLNINIIYLPVTLIKLLRSLKVRFLNRDILNIKSIGSMGEPLSPDVCKWYINLFFKKEKPVINTYFQTETGGIICSSVYSDKHKVPHGSVGKPLNKSIKISQLVNNEKSELLIKKPWPGCMINVINGEKVWNNYWTKKKEFRLFDLGTRDKQGNYFINGRIDDVINIRGHRIGSEEFESIVLKIRDIIECCAISIPDELEGGKFLLFVVPRKKNIIKKDKVIKIIKEYFGAFAIPKDIYLLKDLPKTRSGKIIRRIIRNIAMKKFDRKKDDLSTLLNPNSVNVLTKIFKD